MPKVFRVRPDEGFQELEPVDMKAALRERGSTWKFDGMPIEGKWKPLDVYVRRPTLNKPDVWRLHPTLAFEPEARRILIMCLDQSTQQFALPFEGRKLTVINVTYVLDCLDKKRTVWFDPALPNMIETYAFHEDRLDWSLFKIPETRHGEILTVEGLTDPEDEFKPLVEMHGLKGLRFDLLYEWDSPRSPAAKPSAPARSTGSQEEKTAKPPTTRKKAAKKATRRKKPE